MPLIAVANDAAPVRSEERRVGKESKPRGPPSTYKEVPDSVTVALSLSVTFTVPVPLSVTDAFEVVSTKLARPFSGPSTNWSSIAVAVRLTMDVSSAQEWNDCVFEL